MDLHPTVDQLSISDATNDYLANELPPTRLSHQATTSLSARDWQGLATMGWFSLGLPETIGGLGLGIVEEALVVREFGRNLLPPTTIATMLAAHAAMLARDEGLATSLGNGDVRAGFAIPGDEEGAWRLLDTDGADLFLAWSPGTTSLVPADAFGRTEVGDSFDSSLQVRRACDLDGERVLTVPDDRRFGFRARVLLAAALTGGAEAIRDLSADYAKVRQQFGRPIAQFQAISHKCAAMAVNAEAALSITEYAAVSVDALSTEADMYSAAAFLVAGKAAYRGACDSMQIHGGYGQTYEYLPHFYLKRSILYQQIGGGREAMGASVLEAASTF